MSTPSPLDNVPSLHHHTTLHSPTLNTRAWSSRPHPSASSPLLATATSDKSVHIWDMRGWKLLSTIAGGHKRSVRCVGWKDYGRRKRSKITKDEGGDTEEDGRGGQRDPVVLATGSFDANCGLWVWDPEGNAASKSESQSQSHNVPGSFDENIDEQDFTHDTTQTDESEEWHFSTLLTGPDSEIKDLQFSPPHYGANLLATCSRDKSVWVWEEVEEEEWETVAVLGEHAGDVKCVGWLGGSRVTRGELGRRLRRRRGHAAEGDGGDVGNGEDEEEIILGGRELLASGSYDDTIRLHHDDESEGDWITIAVLTGHEGTVWDLKFESYVNLACYPMQTSVEEIIVDWEPRLISCSDDLTVRVWRKQLSEKERDEKRMRIADARKGSTMSTNGESNSGAPIQTGFASSRLPSVIRPPSSTEKWVEEASLPTVHVRSVYAVDWSAKTGLIVSCGGDGLIAVYREVTVEGKTEDVVMNGTAEHSENDQQQQQEEEGDIKKIKTEWRVVATIEAAHDEYEINHVCWAPVRDQRRQLDAGEVVDGNERDDEEYIVSTGDDGEVKVWKLPQQVLDQTRQNL
ncbi:Cytosolic iron-sulfur protein assembly protein [Knufia fluminis]|uniref:Probable cytosolic iron-sulfur protein assembly protein 1 n=1 Tax=Knufia fluminis TaxID=191047 RepID=A0AAN8EIA1_9EURO|nr:Cytosolic iron-sulfur protein assembly protein [Knufia fluminis]